MSLSSKDYYTWTVVWQQQYLLRRPADTQLQRPGRSPHPPQAQVAVQYIYCSNQLQAYRSNQLQAYCSNNFKLTIHQPSSKLPFQPTTTSLPFQPTSNTNHLQSYLSNQLQAFCSNQLQVYCSNNFKLTIHQPSSKLPFQPTTTSLPFQPTSSLP